MLIFIAIYAPAYSALLISKITGSNESNKNTRVKRIICLIIIWVIATITFIINYIIKVANFSFIILIGGILLGLLPSIAISSGFSDNSEIKKVFESYIRPKGHFGFYLIAIIYLPVVLLIGIAITLALGQSIIWIDLPSGIELLGLIVLTFSYTFFFGGGANEEPG